MAFQIGLRDDQAYLNGIGRFEAKVSGDGDAKWFKNGKEIAADVSMLKFERSVDGEKRILIVKNVTQDDFTKYQIEFNGEKSEASLARQSPFVEKLENQKAQNEGIAVFTCTVRPAVQVTWYKGSQKIDKKSFSILKFEEVCKGDKRMLIVKNIQNAEFCEYSCEAKNEKCSAKLERGTAAPKQAAPAAPKSAMKSADKKKDEKKAKGVSIDSNPTAKVENDEAFKSKVMDITAVMGSIEVFKCEMKDEKALVQWFAPNGSEINMKNFSILKYETGEAGSERKLIVKNIGDNDIGKYKCKSNNSQISFELRSGVKKNVIQVDGMTLMMKRRGSKVDANKEHVLKRAMDKSSSNYKWIRHPDYLNLWIINPNWCPVAGGITSR